MKWKKKYSRVVKRFALFPIEIDGETRWLETVYIKQKRDPFWDFFVNDKFVEKDSYVAYKKGMRVI